MAVIDLVGRYRVEHVLVLRARPCVAVAVMEPPDVDVGIYRARALLTFVVDPDGVLVDLSAGEQREVVAVLSDVLGQHLELEGSHAH